MLEPNCITCEHFESYRDAYDDDPEERDDIGICHLVLGWGDGAGYFKVCEHYSARKNNEPTRLYLDNKK